MTEEQIAKLAEAPASINFYGVTGKGWNIQITLRDADEYNLMERFGKLTVWLDEHHVTPKPVGAQPGAPKAEPAPAQPEAEKANLGIGHYDGIFDANELTCKIEDGQTYWKVRGGQFTKYGITVWPEVFKATGLEFDPMKAPYSLAGWKAAYIVGDEGKPKKVIALLK